MVGLRHQFSGDQRSFMVLTFNCTRSLRKTRARFYAQWRSHWGYKGDRVPPLTAKKIAKNREKEGENHLKNRGKEEKSGRKGKNREGFFHFAPPDR